MFLDEELEQIYQEKGFCQETSKELALACINRIPKYTCNNGKDVINGVKRIDASWQLFCKRHQEFRIDGLRKLYCDTMGISEEKAKNIFGWH